MLKPRRANSPAMRVSTPDLFSTRIDSTCLRPVRMLAAASSSSRLSGSLVAGSPIAELTPPSRVPAARPGSSDRCSPRASRARLHVAVAPVPEQLLPLTDHPQVAVVHDEDLDRDLVLRAGRQLLCVHL